MAIRVHDTDIPSDASPIDDRVRRPVVVGFTWTVVIAGVLWGTMYVLLGVPGAAAYPYGFAGLSVINGLINRRPTRFTVFAASTTGRWSLERDPYLLETSIPGVFAVGDVRSESVKRVASAVGEGSVAIQLVHAYLQA